MESEPSCFNETETSCSPEALGKSMGSLAGMWRESSAQTNFPSCFSLAHFCPATDSRFPCLRLQTALTTWNTVTDWKRRNGSHCINCKVMEIGKPWRIPLTVLLAGFIECELNS